MPYIENSEDRADRALLRRLAKRGSPLNIRERKALEDHDLTPEDLIRFKHTGKMRPRREREIADYFGERRDMQRPVTPARAFIGPNWQDGFVL